MRTPLALVLLPALAFGCSSDAEPLDGLANFTLAPDALDLGVVAIGEIGRGEATVRNTGDRPLELRVQSSGDDVTATLDAAALDPGAETVLRIAAQPTRVGAQSVTVDVSAVGQDSLQRSVAVRFDTALQTVTCTPETLSFGNVVVDVPVRQRITCTNTSDVDAAVTLDTLQNTKFCDAGDRDPAVFCIGLGDRVIDPDGRWPLRAGESAELEVEFRPVLGGTRERGRFVLRPCASSACEIEVRVDGLGIERPLQCAPATVDFGATRPTECLDATLRCENIAAHTVTAQRWGLAELADPGFLVPPSAVTAVTSGDSLDLPLRFCPEATGQARARLDIETDPGGAFQVELRGEGAVSGIAVLPEAVDFSEGAVGVPVRRNVLVTNTGFRDIAIDQILVDDLGTGAFRLAEGSPTVVPPGAAAVFVVEFVPPAPGRYESGLVLFTNDPIRPQIRIPLLGEGVALAPCRSALSATDLDFGEVLIGRASTLGVQVRNEGVEDCLVGGIALVAGSDPVFAVDTAAPTTRRLAPGAAFTIAVTYTPDQTAVHGGQLNFSVSDPSNPFVQVALTGRGVAQTNLLLSDDRLDFGRVSTGCGTTSRPLRVHNPTTQNIVLSQAALPAGAAPFAVSGPGLPATIVPGASVTLQVTFSPSTDGRFASTLVLSGTAGGSPTSRVVGLEGEAAAMGRQIDSFTQGTAKVDALFVADFSGGSVDERTRLSTQFASFIRAADAAGLDYQIGVTSTDANEEAGRLVHPRAVHAGSFTGPFGQRIITPATTNPAAVFEANLLARFASGGAPIDEAGLWSAYLALSGLMLSGHNAGFLRADADLMLIFVADEADGTQFAGVGSPSTNLDFYIDYFRSLKRPGTRFRASSIGGELPGGCSGPSGVAMATPWYVEVAQRTGGVFASICSSDYARVLGEIGRTSFGPSQTFDLAQPPNVASVEVRVDGVTVPAAGNWQLDVAANRLAFTPFGTPAAGSTIEIEYAVACQ